jgi:hypothetical protein
MPYKSRAQQRLFHAKLKRHEISPKVVAEFDSATAGHFKELPEHVPARGKRPTRKKRS